MESTRVSNSANFGNDSIARCIPPRGRKCPRPKPSRSCDFFRGRAIVGTVVLGSGESRSNAFVLKLELDRLGARQRNGLAATAETVAFNATQRTFRSSGAGRFRTDGEPVLRRPPEVGLIAFSFNAGYGENRSISVPRRISPRGGTGFAKLWKG